MDKLKIVKLIYSILIGYESQVSCQELTEALLRSEIYLVFEENTALKKDLISYRLWRTEFLKKFNESKQRGMRCPGGYLVGLRSVLINLLGIDKPNKRTLSDR